MKGVFLGEDHNVGMSLVSANQTQTTSTYEYCLYLRNQILRESSYLFALLDKKTIGLKKRKEFAFSVFPAIPRLALDAPMSRSQLPSVHNLSRAEDFKAED
jgi:hypothetical protein